MSSSKPVPGNSLERMVGLLDLFEESPSGWTFDRIHSRLGYTRSTLYRYLKILSDAELLTSLPEAGYTLGPRIVELDHEIRVHDPIIRASRPVMLELVREIPGIALLCRSYRNKVLCVHQERSTTEIESTYERGRTMPLLRGAASRIILANMPTRTIAALYDRQPREFPAGRPGRSAGGGPGQPETHPQDRLGPDHRRGDERHHRHRRADLRRPRQGARELEHQLCGAQHERQAHHWRLRSAWWRAPAIVTKAIAQPADPARNHGTGPQDARFDKSHIMGFKK